MILTFKIKNSDVFIWIKKFSVENITSEGNIFFSSIENGFFSPLGLIYLHPETDQWRIKKVKCVITCVLRLDKIAELV